jgi:hypothetical protein
MKIENFSILSTFFKPLFNIRKTVASSLFPFFSMFSVFYSSFLFLKIKKINIFDVFLNSTRSQSRISQEKVSCCLKLASSTFVEKIFTTIFLA